MSATLHERLADLAESAAPATMPAGDLWRRGRRRQRVRQAQGVAGVAALLAMAGALAVGVADLAASPDPVGDPDGRGHLPQAVHEPDVWTPGTADVGEFGPLAAVGFAERHQVDGLFGERQSYEPYGVSAVDGTIRFLDLHKYVDVPDPSAYGLALALSPDGRKVAFGLPVGLESDIGIPLRGWGVYDTVTGDVVELVDPEAAQPDDSLFDYEFTADSRYLVTNYSRTVPSTSRTDELVVWDVRSGERMVAEGPGRYWQPSLGSGPEGVVWSRANETFVFDPETRRTTTYVTAEDVVTASFAPTGAGFAYIGSELKRSGMVGPWRLHVGPNQKDMREVPLRQNARAILGWRDATHVVVGLSQDDYVVVDVATGKYERGHISGNVNLFTHDLASDLWAEDLVAGGESPDASDPRTSARLTAGGLSLAVLLVCGFLWRRRRGRA